MAEKNYRDYSVGEEFKASILGFLRENWLSVILAGLGFVLVIAGGIVMMREGSGQQDKELVIEEAGNEKKKITVDIQGAVNQPGVYEFEFGSRVKDLITKAGGLNTEADEDWVNQNLNQAAELKDGEKYYLPKKDENQIVGSQLSVTSKVNINTADLSQLDGLPQIGSARAQKIIENRPYARIEELLEKKIIPAGVFEEIKDQISVY